MRQQPATGAIDNGGEVNKAARLGDVRGVQRPDLIGPHDGKLAQQVRIDLIARRGLALSNPALVSALSKTSFSSVN